MSRDWTSARPDLWRTATARGGQRAACYRTVVRGYAAASSGGPSVDQADDVGGVFADTASVRAGLAAAGYLADDKIAGVVSLAARLGKPLLIEGPAGTGKTQLAKSVAMMADRPLIRLQCYEGIDESKALYEWDYRKQLLWIQAARGDETFSADAVIEDGKGIFDERFLLTRPMLEAIRSPQPVVLLVDEVDRVDAETEALFLEVLAEHQVSVPELGPPGGPPRATGVPHLERHPGPVGGAQAPVPVPLS